MNAAVMAARSRDDSEVFVGGISDLTCREAAASSKPFLNRADSMGPLTSSKDITPVGTHVRMRLAETHCHPIERAARAASAMGLWWIWCQVWAPSTNASACLKATTK